MSCHRHSRKTWISANTLRFRNIRWRLRVVSGWRFSSHYDLLILYSHFMKESDPDNPPDLVIAGALISYRSALGTQGLTSIVLFSRYRGQELLEKPSSKEHNLRMLLDLNGGVCEVVTGLVVGAISFYPGLEYLTCKLCPPVLSFSVPHPCGSGLCRKVRLLPAPSQLALMLSIRSIDERMLIYFADNPRHEEPALQESQ